MLFSLLRPEDEPGVVYGPVAGGAVAAETEGTGGQWVYKVVVDEFLARISSLGGAFLAFEECGRGAEWRVMG